MSSAEQKNTLQYAFLNKLRKKKSPVTLFLISGVKLEGIITWFDSFSVLLKRGNHQQLVYKYAISTVFPANPILIFEEEETLEE